METKIRLLTKKDISDAARIILETKAGLNKGEVEKLLFFSLKKGVSFLNPDYYVLLFGEKPIGVSGLYYDYEDPKDILWMDYFAVSSEFQRHGFGTLMLENLEKVCREKKVKRLCVFAETGQAVNFYEKNGFKIFGRLEDYYGKGRPRIWLSRTIN
jgi:ribosomal protein S18 acetylase RimI-like enzyme